MVCRSVWLASMTCWSPGRLAGSRRGPDQAMVAGEQILDVAGQLDVAGGENDQVVAYPFQVGHQVRRQHHADALVGDGCHQRLQELPPGQRVQAGDRLVEQQQLRTFRDAPGSGRAGPAVPRRAARPSVTGRGRSARSVLGRHLRHPSPG